MRYFINFLILTFLLSQNSFGQIYDVAPTGRENILPVEGGGIKMKIDSITPLDELINKLNSNWRLLETGKFYWIGYTEDMFSIATRKDAAIQPLLNFIDTSQNLHARVGAVYSLHLIGINSSIVSRFSEEFNNLKARSALLAALKYPGLESTIIELLIRDPRISDIPKVFDALSQNPSDCWALNNYLTQFQLPLPIHQEIPLTRFYLTVNINYTQQLEDNFELQFPMILNAIEKAHFEGILVDPELLKNPELWGTYRHSLINSSAYSADSVGTIVRMKDFLMDVTHTSYLEIGSHLQYYLDDNNLYICTQATAKKRLLSWWQNLPESEKAKFNSDVKVKPGRGF